MALGARPDDATRTFCTPNELRKFNEDRESGRVSFFREAACEGTTVDGAKCRKPIPTSRKFCSEKCAGIAPMVQESDDDDGYLD